ncbi:hypothetical protein MATL_G00118280 [Megalops atlanticus]|uniref:Uncharacterized protein n=1 Tax=Megalops atlanticus TaxID=7932 RepID=A0A9D3Q1V2_MEGAT|nr:hypothetical protein MATL_G00118280 [Megalops atlanticus]
MPAQAQCGERVCVRECATGAPRFRIVTLSKKDISSTVKHENPSKAAHLQRRDPETPTPSPADLHQRHRGSGTPPTCTAADAPPRSPALTCSASHWKQG